MNLKSKHMRITLVPHDWSSHFSLPNAKSHDGKSKEWTRTRME